VILREEDEEGRAMVTTDEGRVTTLRVTKTDNHYL